MKNIQTIKKTLSLLLVAVMAFAMTFAYNANPVWAKSKVKKVKVVGVKKNLKMEVGTKKTLKVKVSASKKYRKFKAKTSNKGVVAVKVKKNKIVLTAKKAGKSKITVTSKVNKKKKYSFTVNVNKKTVPANNTKPLPTGLKIPEFKVKAVNRNVFVLSWNVSLDLKVEDLVIEKKGSKEANYIAKIKADALSTDNQEVYTVVVDEYLENGTYVRFSAPKFGDRCTAECEVNFKPQSGTYTVGDSIEANKKFSTEFGLAYGTGAYKLNKIEDVPEGVSYEFNQEGTFSLDGKITKTGVYTMKAEVEDETGLKNHFNVVLLVGSDEAIVAYTKDGQAKAYNKDDIEYSTNGYVNMEITGGSGEYDISLISSDDVFALDYDTDEEMYDVTYEAYRPGTFTAKIKIADKNDPSISTILEYTLEVVECTRLSGTVKTSTGRGIPNATVYAAPVDYYDENDDEVGVTNEDGDYALYLEKGKYNVWAVSTDGSKRSVKADLDVRKDATQDFVIEGLYVVEFEHEGNVPKTFGEWYMVTGTEAEKDYEIVGEGDAIALAPGDYSLVCEDTVFAEDGIYDYKAVVHVTVDDDMVVTPDVEVTEVPIAGTLNIGSTNLNNITEDGVFYRFVAPSDGDYRFLSDFGTEDPYLYILDKDGEVVDSNDDIDDDDYNFDLTTELEGGQEYYIVIGHYLDDDEDGKEPVSGEITIIKNAFLGE